MKYKAYNVTWKCRGYGVDPHRLEKYMVGLEDYRYCKGVRRLGKSLEWRPDPWQDINEKPRKYRSWKAHSKCRHQWERHEPPAIEGGWSWDEDGSKGDHRRKWVMDCLKKKGVCIFNVHHDKGLEILDVPCNQFGGQAPGTDEEIHEFCTVHFNTTFPQMKRPTSTVRTSCLSTPG